MNARVNLQLLATTTFDSGSLGLLAMVVHQFGAAGRYHARVTQHERIVAEVDFDVEEASPAMQLHIDLAAVARKARARPECASVREPEPARTVSPKGYVLFHVSSGSGYAVTVADATGQEVFHSTRLTEGDLFALSLLEPAQYVMTNKLGSAAGEITVKLTPEAAKRLRSLETHTLEVDQKQFTPERIEVAPSQGVVWRVRGPARIVVAKKSSGPRQRTKPAFQWRAVPKAPKADKPAPAPRAATRRKGQGSRPT